MTDNDDISTLSDDLSTLDDISGVEMDTPVNDETEQPVKRRRGRPRKTPPPIDVSFDASDHATDFDVEIKPRPKRTAKLSRAKIVRNTATSYKGAHKVAAMLTDPIMEISDEEAVRLADATVETLDAFGISLENHPKAVALWNMGTAVVEVEVPRIGYLMMSPPKQRNSQQQEQEQYKGPTTMAIPMVDIEV